MSKKNSVILIVFIFACIICFNLITKTISNKKEQPTAQTYTKEQIDNKITQKFNEIETPKFYRHRFLISSGALLQKNGRHIGADFEFTFNMITKNAGEYNESSLLTSLLINGVQDVNELCVAVAVDNVTQTSTTYIVNVTKIYGATVDNENVIQIECTFIDMQNLSNTQNLVLGIGTVTDKVCEITDI